MKLTANNTKKWWSLGQMYVPIFDDTDYFIDQKLPINNCD